MTSNVHAIKDGQDIGVKVKNNNEIDTIEKFPTLNRNARPKIFLKIL